MLSNRLAFAALGIACVTAAAGGGYIAMRQTETPVLPDSIEATAAAAPATGVPLAAPAVQETEGVVGAAPTTPEPAPAPAKPKVQPQRTARADTPSRTAPARRDTAPSVARAEQSAPALERSWPSSAPAPAQAPADSAPSLPAQDEHVAEPPRAPEPPEPTFDELIVSADSVIGLQTETALSSERAHLEDRVEARVIRDVRVGGRVAIPAGTRVLGSVTSVDRGGKMKERARLGIRFHTLAFADGAQTPITTDTIYRYGDAPGNKSAAKIGGGAVAGAILGAIIGGGKGAAIGAATGAGGGTAAVVAGDRSEATFPAGAEVTARILSPVTVTVER